MHLHDIVIFTEKNLQSVVFVFGLLRQVFTKMENSWFFFFNLVAITSLSQCWNITSLDFPTVGLDNPEGFGCSTSPVVGDITD